MEPLPGSQIQGSHTLLSMHGISKWFSDVRVLSDVSFDLAGGEVHVLAGENGAGKSTLMRILAGVYSDFEGTIELRGKHVRFRSPHDAAALGITVMHQEMSLVGPLSIADNILLGREETRWGNWLDTKARYARVHELLADLGLHVNVVEPVEAFPPSVQQMIEIAKALAVHATIFVMDEPTSSLSQPEVERLFAIIAQLKKRGCGIVYISHRLEEIYRIADRVTVLRDGTTIGTETPANLPRTELIRWMVGRPINQQFPARLVGAGQERLRVDHLSVRDPNDAARSVVQDVSFELHDGEILGVAGLQGSGASELLNGVFGTFGMPAGGTVNLRGEPYAIRGPQDSIERGIALLTNDRKATGLIGDMSILHNITIAALKSFCRVAWIRPAQEKFAAQSYTDLLRLRAESFDQDAATLSGGNQQKIVLAKWLTTHPGVFLLDEPTRGVDVGVKHEIYELMNRWTQVGCAIILVTSELPELLAMSDRIMVMCRGRHVATFLRHEATQENIMHAAMGGAP